MACTNGCLTEQKGSPCLKGLPNVEELSQANLNSGFFIYLSSVCRRPRGDVSVLSSQPYVHIPEPGTAVVVLVFHMKMWKREECKGEEKNEDGKGSGKFRKNRSVPQAVLQLILSLTVPLRSKEPK